ncbi:hypothetical protein BC832DRAFT_79639 [Gaertneriomyces semiglobifer]|nr:hypothetical protein BC832DRAFT_79639 [Gaertneriomyces semiglobifer]
MSDEAAAAAPLASLGADVKRRLNALQNLQDKQALIEAEFRKELLELEKKYHGKYQPLYEERTAIVKGDKEPSDEECERPAADEEEEPKEAAEEEKKDAAPVKGVPEFWLTAMKNNMRLDDRITDKDADALKFLTDIKVHYLDNNPGFKLEFYFDENPFFTDAVLTKSYFLEFSPEASFGDNLMYDHAEGSQIHWKEGQDLSVTVEIKKQRHKGTNKTRTVKKTVPAETFFRFFSPPKAPSEDEEVDEDELEDLDAMLEDDYEIGELFKEKIVPHAVDWFTGKALEYEEDEEGGMDEWYGGESDDDDMDDDDEDNAAEGEEGAASTEKPPECKQQ